MVNLLTLQPYFKAFFTVYVSLQSENECENKISPLGPNLKMKMNLKINVKTTSMQSVFVS